MAVHPSARVTVDVSVNPEVVSATSVKLSDDLVYLLGSMSSFITKVRRFHVLVLH